MFSVGEDGSLVYLRPGGVEDYYSLSWVTQAGDETPLAAPPRAYGDMRVSPDGTRIALRVSDSNNIDVWIWHLDDGPLTRLTFDESTDFFPLWTPNGERVVFSSGASLFWKAADGTGDVERLLESADVGLIRSRGHFPKGGYDVHDGSHRHAAPGAATVQ